MSNLRLLDPSGQSDSNRRLVASRYGTTDSLAERSLLFQTGSQRGNSLRAAKRVQQSHCRA